MFSKGTNLPKSCNLIGNHTIKRQILMISFLFSTIILGILLGAVLISQEYISQALQDASNNIFRVQTKAYMNYVWIYQHGMEEVIAITAHHLSTVRKLNNFVQSAKEFITPKPKMCLLNLNERDSYCFNNSMCCGVFGGPLNSELEGQLTNIMITTSLMDVLRLEYDFTSFSPISFSFNNSAQYYCFSTGFPFPTTFQPHYRPYYLETLNQMLKSKSPEEFYFASPYSTLTSKIRRPMTTALLDKEHQFIGLIAKDLDFNYTQIEKPKLQNITNYILAHDGKVVFTDKYRVPSQPVFYLNESQYSGFNQYDFEQIMFQHYGKQFQSNCNNFDFNNVLCRYNTLMMDNVIVRTANITTSPYILVQLSKTNKIKQQESIHIELLNRELSSLLKWSIILIFIISLGIIVFGQVITNVILRQLNNFIKRIEQLICETHLKQISKIFLSQHKQKKGDKSEMFKQNIIESNCVSNLQSTIANLFSSLNIGKKSEECRLQENLPFQDQKKVNQEIQKELGNQQIFQKIISFKDQGIKENKFLLQLLNQQKLCDIIIFRFINITLLKFSQYIS